MTPDEALLVLLLDGHPDSTALDLVLRSNGQLHHALTDVTLAQLEADGVVRSRLVYPHAGGPPYRLYSLVLRGGPPLPRPAPRPWPPRDVFPGGVRLGWVDVAIAALVVAAIVLATWFALGVHRLGAQSPAHETQGTDHDPR